MNSDDLLKLLDLNGKPPIRADPIVTSIPSTPTPESHPTALELDAWGLRRGRELNAEPALAKLALGELAVADFFAAAFDPSPTLTPACTDAARHRFVAALLESPEYRVLHADTMLDDTAAEIAALAFARRFATPAPTPTHTPKGGKTEGESSPTDDGDLGSEVAVMRSAAYAVSDAREEVEELREAVTAVGLGPGSPGSNDPTRIAPAFKRVRGSAALWRICALAGRFRRVAQSKQRQKVAHGADEVVGVEVGGDLARILPSELVKLAIAELELDTLRRLVERQLLCRDVRGVEPVGKGPILVVLDESGSMEGQRVETAKALALALAWIARRQRRWAGLIAYSGNSGERLLALPPGRWDESQLLDWLAAFIGKGSELDVPLEELPRMYQEIGAPKGKTDVVMVTDCRCRIAAPIRELFLAWKQSVTARVLTLVIGDNPGDLAGVSDEIFKVESLDPTGDAIGHILSI